MKKQANRHSHSGMSGLISRIGLAAILAVEAFQPSRDREGVTRRIIQTCLARFTLKKREQIDLQRAGGNLQGGLQGGLFVNELYDGVRQIGVEFLRK